MVKYTCDRCGNTSMRSIPGWRVECKCGGWQTTEEKPKIIMYDNSKLQQARKEALSKVTRLWRHVFQCPDCLKTKEQYDFDYIIPCVCGGKMYVQFTYIGKDEYYAIGGELVKKKNNKQVNENPLKQYRQKNNLTQDELAEKLGVSRGYIAQIETGKKPIPNSISEMLPIWI